MQRVRLLAQRPSILARTWLRSPTCNVSIAGLRAEIRLESMESQGELIKLIREAAGLLGGIRKHMINLGPAITQQSMSHVLKAVSRRHYCLLCSAASLLYES